MQTEPNSAERGVDPQANARRVALSVVNLRSHRGSWSAEMPTRKAILVAVCAGVLALSATATGAQTGVYPSWRMPPHRIPACRSLNHRCDERRRCCEGLTCQRMPDRPNSGICRRGQQIAH